MIDSFSGKYRFLSNFWPCHVTRNGFTYPSVEHAYQAAKTTDPVEHAYIMTAYSAGQAKSYGRQIRNLRSDWNDVRIGIMQELLQQKFSDLQLRTKLENTASEVLVEGNYWGDTFWGMCRGVGQNHLGKLLMEIRGK